MQINTLKRKTKNKRSIAVGRGGTRGKTSGRGTKGQNARSGRKKRPELRDIIKKLPKMRGRGKNGNTSIQTKPVVINLGALNAAFSSGDKVNPSTLVSKGVLEIYKGRTPKVKIVSTGEITFKVMVSDCSVSAVAKDKIKKAGGEVK
jgi:large subunit ribosomal protein L15